MENTSTNVGPGYSTVDKHMSPPVRPLQTHFRRLHEHSSLAQEHFAVRFGISVAAPNHWDEGDRSLSSASLVFLNPIDRNPSTLLQALPQKTQQELETQSYRLLYF